jgi:hypothetical protein
MNGPGKNPSLPVEKPGMLCIANTASHGNCSSVCDPSLTPYRREPAGAKMVST